MRAHHWPAKTAPRSAAALRSTGPSIHPLPPTPLACPFAPRCPLPNGFCLAQYDLARCRLLRLSELAVGDDYGATTPAPRCSALRASHGPSICRAVTYAATLEKRYKRSIPSNPPLSSSQSALWAFLVKAAKNCRIRTGLCQLKGTGEATNCDRSGRTIAIALRGAESRVPSHDFLGNAIGGTDARPPRQTMEFQDFERHTEISARGERVPSRNFRAPAAIHHISFLARVAWR